MPVELCSNCGSDLNGANFCANCGTEKIASQEPNLDSGPGQVAAPAPAQTVSAPLVVANNRTNPLAIVALVTPLVGFGIAGIICGHIALNQIKQTQENGRGLAIAGLALGYASVAFVAIGFVISLAVASYYY